MKLFLSLSHFGMCIFSLLLPLPHANSLPSNREYLHFYQQKPPVLISADFGEDLICVFCHWSPTSFLNQLNDLCVTNITHYNSTSMPLQQTISLQKKALKHSQSWDRQSHSCIPQGLVILLPKKFVRSFRSTFCQWTLHTDKEFQKVLYNPIQSNPSWIIILLITELHVAILVSSRVTRVGIGMHYEVIFLQARRQWSIEASRPTVPVPLSTIGRFVCRNYASINWKTNLNWNKFADLTPILWV